MKRIFEIAAGTVLVFAIASGGAAPAAHADSAGFCCKPVKLISLRPTPDGAAAGFKYGRAEVDECLGMSFVRVVVRGSVPDGTPLLPALPGREPILGDWFSMSATRGETVMQGLSLGQVSGRVLDVVDESFTPLLEGQF